MSLTRDLLIELFDYDQKKGLLLNKINRSSIARKGKVAGVMHHTGYLYVQINKKSYAIHRLIWLIEQGFLPEQPYEIDHVDGVRDNNKIENLRIVVRQENTKNQKIRKNNTSGVMGVAWDKSRSRWVAYIQAEGKRKKLGLYKNKDDAVKARSNAERKYGYHKNHGRSE